LKIIKTKLDGVVILEPKVFGDSRGFFQESYSKRVFEGLGLNYELIQDNHSLSVEAGTLRGLHYQTSPKAQTKIVRAITGAILDVVVDIREGSPTYREHISVILSADNHRQIIVPKGFAHGVLTLVPNVHLLYKVDEFYSPQNDRCIRWDDPELNIDWNWSSPILSEKDANAPFLKDVDNNFIYGEI
jgi:dTDP-4-dehydrorhamnose 3,5-epimerase